MPQNGEDDEEDDDSSTSGEHDTVLAKCNAFFKNISSATEGTDITIPEEFKVTIEGLVALYFAARDCNTLPQFIAIMVLYVRANVKGSLCGSIIRYIHELFHSGNELDEQSSDKPKWLQYLREGKSYYKLLKNHCIFGQLSKLMGLLVVLGICNASTLDFDIAGFKLFDSKVVNIFDTCDSIVDAGLKVILYFCEAGYQCFVKGSLKPLLFNEHEAVEIDDEYHQLVSWWEVVQAGNLEKVCGITDAEFDQRLEKLGMKLRDAHASMSNPVDKKILSAKIHTLSTIKNEYVTLKISGGVRRAPFSIELFGKSSQGKSTFGDTLIDGLLMSADLPIANEYRATINAADDFMSNWTSDKIVAILDDVANEKADRLSTCPTRHIIDICNNERYYANKAELNLKGKCFVEPEIVIATTNKKDLDAFTYSNCPYSVQRRMKYVITVECRPELTKLINGTSNCGMSAAKVHAQNTYKGVFSPPAVEDNWLLTVETAVMPQKLTDTAKYEVVRNKYDGNKPLKNVSAQTVIAFLIEEFHAWRAEQYNLVKSKEKRAEQMAKCVHKGCRQLMQTCPYHSHENALAEAQMTRERVEALLEEPEAEPPMVFTGKWEHNKDVNINAIKETVDEFHRRKLEKDALEMDAEGSVLSPLLYSFSVGGSFLTRRLTARGITRRITKKINMDIDKWNGNLIEAGTSTLYNYMLFLEKKWNWWAALPEKWTQSPAFREYVCWYKQDKIKQSIFRNTLLNSFGMLTSVFMTVRDPWTLPMTLPVFATCAIRQSGVIRCAQDDCLKEILQRRRQIPQIVRNASNKTLSNLLLTSSVLASIYVTTKMWSRWRAMNCQGNLEPTTPEDVAERDAEENQWAPLLREEKPVNLHTCNTTGSQLQGILEKNLVHGSLMREGESNLVLNALLMNTNCCLIPNHYFEKQDEFRAVFKRHNKVGNAQKYRTIVSKAKSVLLPGTDIRLCYTPSGGSVRDISRWLPNEDSVGNVPFKMLHKRKDGSLISAQGICAKQMISAAEMTYDGYYYSRLTMDTFHGLCGAPIFSETKNPVILGIHLAGKAGTPLGGAGIIYKRDYEQCYRKLSQMEGVVLPGSSGDLPDSIMGVKYLCTGETDKKSPLRFLPHGSQFQNFGRCTGGATYYSSVIQLPISRSVEEVMGVENKWGKPKFQPAYFGWQKCLENASLPALPFESWLLDHAINDYQRPLIDLCKSELWRDVAPLTNKETINGIPGRKFIDSMNMSTSIGYPLTGSKMDYVIEHDSTGEAGINRDFKPVVWDEINRVEKCLRNGERAYCIAKACKKDEVLPTEKDKCRIFYGNSIALTFLVRKYYLPLVRILQMNPLVSECAVGVNCHSQEWEQLNKHMDRFGRDRTIGGDYSKYDQKLPSQLLFAALRILMNMAKALNYDDDDLQIMNALCGELVYAYVAFNGDLISVTEGLHISGNSLTVILNGICGSLNLRCFYFSVYPSSDNFRDYVSLLTYGDDNKGSASSERPLFNVAAAAKFLGTYGQTYTNPDKTAADKPYLNPDTCDFLKRTSVYHPQLNLHLGALSEESLFKMLHNALLPRGALRTPVQAAGENIDTALSEWFNHGEKKYELRRRQLTQIIEKHSLHNQCSGHLLTYGDRVDRWRENYENPGSAGA